MTFSVSKLKLLGVGLAAVSILTGCATAKVGDAGKMKSAAPATVKLSAPKKTVIPTVAAPESTSTSTAAATTSSSSTTSSSTTAATTTTEMAKEEKKKKKKKKKAPGILDDVYVVKEGDNLWCISKLRAVYDDAYMWPLIYKRNMDTIKDPDLIFPGQRLWIERDNSTDAIEAAKTHARTRGAWSVGPLEASDSKYIGN